MTRNRLLVIGVLAFVLITAIWWFLFMAPKNSAIADAGDDLDGLRSEETLLQERRDELQRLAQNEPAYQMGILELESSIPAFPGEAALIETFFAKAEEAGFVLNSLTPTPPNEVAGVEGLQQISLAVVGEARYFELLAFLTLIEQEPRLIRIDNLDVSFTSTEDEDTLQVSLSATAFSKLGIQFQGDNS
jgi:Tfp pilus assembly protein PilO